MINRLLKLTFIFCLLATLPPAQIIPDVTPDNIEETVDLIFELHGGIIESDYSTVYDFIDDLLPDSMNAPAYDEFCPPPNAVIDSADSATISTSWNAIPGIYSYQATFLKLNQFPSAGQETGSTITIDTSVQFSVSNGLILMAFQTECTPGKKGRLSIIIVDKPVFFGALAEDCQCTDPRLPIETKPFGFEAETASFDYSHEGAIGYYQGTIENGDVDAGFLIKVEFSDDGDITIYKRSGCMTNLYDGPGILYHQEDEDGDIIGSITFSDSIKFNPTPGRTGNFTVAECLPKAIPKSKSPLKENPFSVTSLREKGLQVIPNPARETVSIIIPQDLKVEANNCFLIDAFGKQIPMTSNPYSFKNNVLKIPVNHLPVGVYGFVIQNKEEIMQTRFVKIN